MEKKYAVKDCNGTIIARTKKESSAMAIANNRSYETTVCAILITKK